MDIAAYAQEILEHLDVKSKPCGRSFIPASKKCSPEKARMTSTAIRERGGIDKFKQKQRKQNALRSEVKRSAGQKPREIPEDVLKTRAAFKQGIAATKGKSLSPTYQEAIKRVQETGRVEDFRQGTKDLLNQVRDEKAAKRAQVKPVGETFVKPKEEEKPKEVHNKLERNIQDVYSELVGDDNSGEGVNLSTLREKLGTGKSRKEVDDLLRQMQLDGKLVLMRQDDPRAIKQKDVDAAIDIGGEARHVVYMKDKFLMPKDPSQLEESKPKSGVQEMTLPDGRKVRYSMIDDKTVGDVEFETKYGWKKAKNRTRDQVKEALFPPSESEQKRREFNRIQAEYGRAAQDRDEKRINDLWDQMEAMQKGLQSTPKDPSQLSDKDLYKAYSESSYSTPEGKAINEEVKRRRKPKPNIVGQLEEGAKQAQKERVERFRSPGGKKNEPTMTIIPGSSRQPSKAAIKTKSGKTIRASIDSAHERGVMKALAFYAEANGL